jgi:uncharacterized protein YjbJ (UPF0337 family)
VRRAITSSFPAFGVVDCPAGEPACARKRTAGLCPPASHAQTDLLKQPYAGSFALRRVSAKERGMSSTTDKVKGTANKVAGKVKQGVGEATDDPALKGEGKVQEAKGDVQKAVGNAKDAIKKATDL